MSAELARSLLHKSILIAGGVLATSLAGAVTLPADTTQLKPSGLPGYTIAQRRCAICHSADYISLQPPDMTIQQWTAEMVKMQRTYGAPLEDGEVKLLGEYLGVTYGGQPLP